MNESKPKECCQHIITTGKNKNKKNQCGKEIVCDKYKLCNKHNNARIAENYKLHKDFGNPDQVDSWVKWINSVTHVPSLVDDKK